MYDQVLRHYLALKAGHSGEATGQAVRTSVHWLNRMFATEPLVNTVNRSIMYDFYFNEEHFVVDDETVRNHYLGLVAYNIQYLVLAAMSQRKRAQGVCKQPILDNTSQGDVPKPLTTGMFHPPQSAFTQGYLEKTIRFPCTLSELYSDQKTYGK